MQRKGQFRGEEKGKFASIQLCRTRYVDMHGNTLIDASRKRTSDDVEVK